MATLDSGVSTSIPRSADRRRVPPLAQGDRLTRSEFLDRYALMPEHIKAERIEGMVFMPAAAVTAEFHAFPHSDVQTWLGVYRAATPGIRAGDNGTIALDLDNDPQPDACLCILSSHGGNTKINSKGYIEGAPELIVEVAASSVSFDLGAKLGAYRRNGVREYLVHRTYDGEFDWFVLRDGQYQRLSPDAQGVYRSEVFPGLWLAADALIAGRLAEVLTTLQRGVGTAEHAAFVKKLEDRNRAAKS
jgi:Uma2 family endonuclease